MKKLCDNMFQSNVIPFPLLFCTKKKGHQGECNNQYEHHQHKSNAVSDCLAQCKNVGCLYIGEPDEFEINLTDVPNWHRGCPRCGSRKYKIKPRQKIEKNIYKGREKPMNYMGTGYTGYNANRNPGIILVMRNKKVIEEIPVDRWDGDWLELAAKVFPHTRDKDGDWLIEVPEKCVEGAIKETMVSPSFNGCVFDSTKDFLVAMLGRSLTSDDKDWLAHHQFATSTGIPQSHTPTCVHQLVLPYGLGVSRVRVPKGDLVEDPDLALWMTILGCNPLAMVDHVTTNEEAAKQMNIPIEKAKNLWRFDFHEACFIPAIVGKESGGGTVVGSSLGHASFYGPRAKYLDGWRIAVQIDRLDAVPYDQKALSRLADGGEKRPGVKSYKLELDKVRDPKGEVFAVLKGAWWEDPKEVEETKHTESRSSESHSSTFQEYLGRVGARAAGTVGAITTGQSSKNGRCPFAYDVGETAHRCSLPEFHQGAHAMVPLSPAELSSGGTPGLWDPEPGHPIRY